jgi:dCTP deaminase
MSKEFDWDEVFDYIRAQVECEVRTGNMSFPDALRKAIEDANYVFSLPEPLPRPNFGIKNDEWIRKQSLENNMINPFYDYDDAHIKLFKKQISFGLTSYGYDFRVDNHFKVFTNARNTVIDPKDFKEDAFVDFIGDVCIVPPNSFTLARSFERFKIPRNILCLCIGKSTYARCGIIVNITPLEPEWEGYLTVEISNTTPLPCKIYANEGIGQLLFFEGDPCEVSYADKKGAYQNQKGITLPKLRNKDV